MNTASSNEPRKRSGWVENLEWTGPRDRMIAGRIRSTRSASPNEEFMVQWRTRKEALREAGIRLVEKDGVPLEVVYCPRLTAVHRALALWAMAQQLAEDDGDHALERNGCGYNRMDSRLGHQLAKKEAWMQTDVEQAYRMLRKYRRQIDGDAYADVYAGKPPRLPGRQLRRNGRDPAGPEVRLEEDAKHPRDGTRSFYHVLVRVGDREVNLGLAEHDPSPRWSHAWAMEIDTGNEEPEIIDGKEQADFLAEVRRRWPATSAARKVERERGAGAEPAMPRGSAPAHGSGQEAVRERAPAF